MSLDDTVGKTISDFCGCGYTDPQINHCAHFISHYLKLQFGMTCLKLTGHREVGANVRVHEVFAQCPEVGWLENWSGSGQVLAFVMAKTNVSLANKTMQNVPKKGNWVNTNTSRLTASLYLTKRKPRRIMRNPFYHYNGTPV
jgi:hypothetical protein